MAGQAISDHVVGSAGSGEEPPPLTAINFNQAALRTKNIYQHALHALIHVVQPSGPFDCLALYPQKVFVIVILFGTIFTTATMSSHVILFSIRRSSERACKLKIDFRNKVDRH